jgi:hypothetical protein
VKTIVHTISPTLNRARFAHPFLLGLLFVLDGINRIKEYAFPPAAEIAVAAGTVLGGIALLFLMVGYCMKNPARTALTVTIILVPALFYSAMQGQVGSSGLGMATRARYMMGALALVTPTLVWALARSKKPFLKLSLCLSTIAAALCILTLFQAARHEGPLVKMGNNRPPTGVARLHPHEARAKAMGALPDIYYLVLDSYTSAESLTRFWNYDDSGFINYLRGKGFYVAGQSRSNYTTTAESIASSLNMAYVDARDLRSADRYARLNKRIRDSAAVKILESEGYDVINLSLFDIGEKVRLYSCFLPDPSSLLSFLYFQTIVGRLRQEKFPSYIPDVNRRILSTLKELPGNRSQTPRFVYAHLMCPHAPYLLDRDGGSLVRKSFFNYFFMSVHGKSKYLEQLIYVNKAMREVVDAVLERSARTPIVIIQGDHGYRFLSGKDQADEADTILNAYHLPDGGDRGLYRSISPVNSFRVVLGYYFGRSYAVLKDRRHQNLQSLAD